MNQRQEIILVLLFLFLVINKNIKIFKKSKNRIQHKKCYDYFIDH